MENKFLFFSWVYDLMKDYDFSMFDTFLEAGVNLPMSPVFTHDNAEDVEKLKKLLDYAEERGVQMILHAADFSTGGYRKMGEEKWSEEFKKFYEETLERHPAIYGFYVGDEPSDAYWLELTRQVIIKMTEIHPNLKPYINFTGSMNTFGPDRFGGIDMVEWLTNLKNDSGEFLHTYDMYPQVINNGGGTTAYFEDCKKNAEASEAAGITPIACLICSAHMVFRPVQPLYGINWQVSTAAACGFKGVNWFRLCDRLVDPNYHASPIDAFGNKTDLYYDVLRAQKTFTYHYGDIFMHLKRKSTYFFGEDMKRDIYPRFEANTHPIMKDIKAGWEESLVSFFEHDETGEEYFAIVNLSRQHYDHYMFYCDAEKYGVNHVLRNGAHQISVPVGDAAGDFEGHFLYPGQLGLFKIVKK